MIGSHLEGGVEGAWAEADKREEASWRGEICWASSGIPNGEACRVQCERLNT